MPVLGCGAEMAKLMEVSDQDIAVIEDTIAERLELGVSQAQAQRQAVDEALAQLADERSMVMKAVMEQLGVKDVPEVRFGNKANDMFPEEFATPDTEGDSGVKITSKGATRKGANVNSDRQQITATKQGVDNFWKWFGDSAAADDKGRPLVLYHSTNGDFNTFEPGRETTNSTTFGDVETQRHGVFMSPDKKFSQEYLREGEGQNVMQVYSSIQNPIDLREGINGDDLNAIIEAHGNDGLLTHRDFNYVDPYETWTFFDGDFGKRFVNAAKAAGFDGAIMLEAGPDGNKPATTYVAFDANQVKSATGNLGTFKADSGDIRFANKAQIEQEAYDMIEADPEGMVESYLTKHKNVIDPDLVKGMFPAFAADPSLAAAVHEPSSKLAKMIYTEALGRNKGKPVVFTAGGGGSGKSEAMPVAMASAGVDGNPLTYDSTLSSYSSAKQRIDQALASESLVLVIYTNAPVERAFKFAMGRDRVVPATTLTAAHVGASNTIRRLAEHYKGNPAVNIVIINNDGAKEDIRRGSLDDVPQYDHNDTERSLYELASQARDSGQITNEKFAALMAQPRGDERSSGQSNRTVQEGYGRQELGRPSERAGSEEQGGLSYANKANTGSLWEVPADTNSDKVIARLQDGRVDLKRVQDEIAAVTKRPIAEAFDARLAETLYAGRVANRADDFLKLEAKPLLESMAKNNVAMDELSDYLLARHAPEANAQIAKQGEIMDGGAGSNSKGVLMTTAAANAYIANLSPGKRVLMQMLAKRVDDITQGTRDVMLAEGLATKDEIANWQGAYKFYVPLYKEDATTTDGTAHPAGSGFSVTGANSKRRMGSSKQVSNMLAHVLMQREAAITRAEKNRVAMALYGLALTNPNPDFWTTIKPNMDSAALSASLQNMGVPPDAVLDTELAPTIRTINKSTGLAQTSPNPLYKQLDNAMVVKVDGQDRVIVFNMNNPRAARLVTDLKNLDAHVPEFLEFAAKYVGGATRFIASMATQYNPAFGAVNVTRDTLGALVNLSSTPLKGQQLKVIGNMKSAAVGIASELTGKGQGNAWSTLYKEFKEAGAQTGYREAMRDPHERASKLESELKNMSSAGKLTPRNAAVAILSALDGYNTTLENTVRLATYKVALDNGMSKAAAARIARELTVDFNRKGAWAKNIGPFYAFFNAAVQGNARTIVTAMAKNGGYIVAGGIGLGIMNAVLLAAAGYDDDEVSEFAKARAFIVPLGVGKDGKKEYFSLPMPLGLHVLPNAGRTMMELAMSGGDDWQTKTWNALGETIGSFNPLGGANPFTAQGWVKMFAPTVADPLIDLAQGTDFANRPISKLSNQERERDPRPGFQLARESTERMPSGELYKGIAQVINAMTGGNEFRKGASSPTPEEVRYTTMAIGGGLLREIEKGINATIRASKGEDVKPHEVPLSGRFFGEVDDDQVQKTRFYKNTKKIDALESELKSIYQAGRSDEGNQMLKDKPLAGLYPLNDAVNSSLRQLNKMAKSSIGDPAAMKQLDKDRAQVMRQLNEAVRKLEKASDKAAAVQQLNPVEPEVEEVED